MQEHCCSVTQSSSTLITPWTALHQVSLSFTISQSLLKLLSIESVMASNNLVLCHPLLLLSSIFPSISTFSSESVIHIRWPKYWSFSFSICPYNESSGLTSFRIDWFDLLAVQGTLKSLLKTAPQFGDLLQKDLCQPHVTSQDYCNRGPWPHSKPRSTHASAGDSQTHTGKSGSVSCGVSAPFSWVLVHTLFCLFSPRVCFPSPVEVLYSNPTDL